MNSNPPKKDPQKSPRYFYDRAIDAVWMHQCFGMRFVSWHSGKEYEIDVIRSNVGSPIKSISEEQKYVIHPDDVHMLIPRAEDICVNPDSIPAIVLSDEKFKLGLHDIHANAIPLSTALEFVGDSAVIIQRDQKAFLWPQKEGE